MGGKDDIRFWYLGSSWESPRGFPWKRGGGCSTWIPPRAVPEPHALRHSPPSGSPIRAPAGTRRPVARGAPA